MLAQSHEDKTNLAREAILAHLPEFLGPEAANIRSVEIRHGRRFGERRGHYHRVAELAYANAHGEQRLKVWLKFCNEDKDVFDTYRKAYEANGWAEYFLPRPYFCHSCRPLNTYIWATEHVSGNRLREVLLRSSVTRDPARLEALFFRLGARLRSFHDALATTATCTIDGTVARLIGSVWPAAFLTNAERRAIITNIHHAADIVGSGRRFRLTRTHNDLTPRNVILRPNGSVTVIDLNGFREPEDSGWYDAAYLLLMLQGMSRYRPVVSAKSTARLSAAFIAGYRGAGHADGLSDDEAQALIYLFKLEYLFGTHFSHFLKPLHVAHRGALGRRFIGQLKAEALRGAEAVSYQ